jgi:hypothetical protein
MRDVQKGDIVALKVGLCELKAAGEVVERNGKAAGCGDKNWLSDIDGWDLPAYCYVDWHVPEKPVQTYGFTRETIEQIHRDNLKSDINQILALPVRAPDSEPSETKSIENDDLLEFLVVQGLRPSAASDLTEKLGRIRLLAQYYYKECEGNDIREHETRSFLVIPFLLALGWSEQQIKIELPCSTGTMDIACFSEPYRRKPNDCVLIVETKQFSSGLDYAPEQACTYAGDFPACRVVLVTNGCRYKAYVRRDDGSFSTTPSAYLNLLNPRDLYPLDPKNVKGALEVLRWLLPDALKGTHNQAMHTGVTL